MNRARRHPTSYSSLEPGDRIELYSRGDDPNGPNPPDPQCGDWVRAPDDSQNVRTE